jgi:hypothetical protein
MHLTATRFLGLAAACLIVASPALAPTSSQAARPLPCRAHVSDSTPADYSTVKVMVKTAPRAHVHTVAHYKTTTNAKNRTANIHGNATIAYDIYTATPGYRVTVSVTVSKKGRPARTCSTSFTPHR